MRLYTAVLLISFGICLSIGILVIPVIFNSGQYLSSVDLSNFEEGLLMSGVFYRFKIFISFIALIVFIFEFYFFIKIKKDWLSIIFSFLFIASALSFSYYYFPYINNEIKKGEEFTKNDEFKTIHKNSENATKIFTMSLLVLAIRKTYMKKNKT